MPPPCSLEYRQQEMFKIYFLTDISLASSFSPQLSFLNSEEGGSALPYYPEICDANPSLQE